MANRNDDPSNPFRNERFRLYPPESIIKTGAPARYSPEVFASIARTGGEGRATLYKKNSRMAAAMDLDSVVRRTAIPLIQRELAPGCPDILTDHRARKILSESELATAYPVLTKFLPESDRFFEHAVLSMEKQEAASSMLFTEMSRSKSQEALAAWYRKNMQDRRYVLATLYDERTKRIIMDARQAATFSEVGEAPPDDWQRKLRMPFDWFFLEFSQGVSIGEQEPIPDTEETVGMRVGEDIVRAILVRRCGAGSPTRRYDLYSANEKGLLQNHPITPGVAGFMQLNDAPNEHEISFFLTDSIGHHTKREFIYELATGKAFISIDSIKGTQPSPGREWAQLGGFDTSEVPEVVMENPQLCIPAGHPLGMGNRYIGWWERTVLSYSSLLSWTLTYMMSKGIEIAEERLPRAMRRREQRKDIPRPWHIVQVEPRLRASGGDGEMEGQQRSAHNIRYDVIGHLRCIQKKNENGTTSNSFVWVRPHQRGLANDIYVPKTSNFKGGKEIHPVMNSYFPPEPQA